ncbi:unnamed protein product [Effrenium voratum]|nr:unnamed protein product [Effrenium voratum]
MALREDQVHAAVSFLTHDRGLKSWIADKEDFLLQKGLSQGEVAEAMRRALAGPHESPAPPVLPVVIPSAWQLVQTLPRRKTAPWWALLLSGLGFGVIFALLLRLWSWRRQAQKGLPAPAVKRDGRLKELLATVRCHTKETREATASLRQSAEQQERLYQMSALDFQRRMDDATRRRPKRMEVAPESLQLLRTLVAGDEGYPQWFQRASAAVQRLVTQSSSLAVARRSLQTLLLILQNRIVHPSLEKYREVNASSTRFRETFAEERQAIAAELLCLAGFEQRGESFIASEDLSQAERLRDLLQEALRDLKGRWSQSAPAA